VGGDLRWEEGVVNGQVLSLVIERAGGVGGRGRGCGLVAWC
jgi:hypothetical protein